MSESGLVIRPRRVRTTGIVLAVLMVVSFVVLSIALNVYGAPGWTPTSDPVWMIAIGVLFAAILLRFSAMCAIERPEGLFVRNLVVTRTYPWAQIVGLTYSSRSGDPWAKMDLVDGTSQSVMAIQSADGAQADADAEALRAVIDTHLPSGGDS